MTPLSPWEHRLVLKNSSANSDIWFLNLARSWSNDSDSSIDNTEEILGIGAVKKCYYASAEKAYEHGEILATIVAINTAFVKNINVLPPYCISSFLVNDQGNRSNIAYNMLRYSCSLTEWISRRSMQETACNAPILLVQIAEAMEMLHDASLIHLDLKPDNILINEWPSIRAFIADFDTTMFTNETSVSFHEESDYMKQVNYHGTPAYSAPEHFIQRVCKASDVWSFGCIALQLCTGVKELWPSVSMFHIFHRVTKFAETAYDNVEAVILNQAELLNNGINHELLDMVRSDLLRHDVNARLSFSVITKKIRRLCNDEMY